MKIPKLSQIQVRPTDRKMKQAKHTIESFGIGLPSATSVNSAVCVYTPSEISGRVMSKIQLSANKMTRGNS